MKYITICVALYDYKAQNEEEISFNADNTLYILDKEDPDWYKAQLKVPASQDGPIGLIPANYVENAKPMGAVKAVYDYTSQSEEELSFKQDEVLTLYEKDDPDWLIVEKPNGDIGLAPSNYVEETILTQTTHVEPKPSVNINKAPEPLCEPKWAITLYAFSPENEEETYLNDHEQVLVTEYISNKDWWTIEHKDGTSGIVPSSYIKFQDEYEADLRKEEEEEKKRELALKEQKIKAENEVKDRELAERNRVRDLEEKEKARQLEVERRRKMQDEAKQKEIEAKRQASFAANAIASPQLGGGSPRRSQIPAPPPPTKSTPDPTPVTAPPPVHNDPTKPDPSKVRMWTDRTGAFKVEAQFVSCANGKIRLFKTNGVKIDVPTQKMCMEDLRYIEHETGMKLIEDKSDNIPLGQLNNSRFSWFDYFKRANLPHNASIQYAKAFDLNGLSEKDVDRLTYRQMKALGMTERHVHRIQRFIETNQTDPPSDDESASKPKIKTKKSVTFGGVSYIEEEGDNDIDDVQWQIEQDERLARELQEQEQGTNSSTGLHRRGTGRPTPAQSAPRGVSASILTPQKFEPLKPTPSPKQQQPTQPVQHQQPLQPIQHQQPLQPIQHQQPLQPIQHQQPLQPSPSPQNVIPTPPKSNFDDDAWSPRVGASPSVQTATPPVWNQQQQLRSIDNNNTPPQIPPRQRPTPSTSQQSLVDPQLLAKWGGSPALAAANYNRPVPPPPTSSTPTLNSLTTAQQAPFYQQQQATGMNNSFAHLQPNNGSFTSLQGNGSFTNFQQQASPFQQQQTLPQQQASPFQQQQTLPQQQLPIQQQSTGFTPQMYNTTPQQQTLQPTGQSFIGSSPVPLQSILPLTPQQAQFQQPQMTGASGRSWAAATPDNPFGGASPAVQNQPNAYQQQQQSFIAPQNTGYVPQQGYTQQQYNNTIDPNDKYSVFKTVNTSTPSVFNNNNQRF